MTSLVHIRQEFSTVEVQTYKISFLNLTVKMNNTRMRKNFFKNFSVLSTYIKFVVKIKIGKLN